MSDEDALTIERIESGRMAEGQDCEFKARLDFDSSKVRRDLRGDVVAFLNSGPGRIFIGVREGKKREFSHFEPYAVGADDLCRRVTSLIQDSIDPKPMEIVVRPISIEDGFILEIRIPEHPFRPYQDRPTGSFMMRTGRQNTPIPRDQVRALFTGREEFEAEAARLMARELNEILQLEPAPPPNADALSIAIVPKEFFQRGLMPFSPKRSSLSLVSFRHFHGGSGTFKGTTYGFESLSLDMPGRPISRFFIGDDWLIHSWTAYPLQTDGSHRLKLPEFRETLSGHLAEMGSLLADEGLAGPFAVLCRLDGLQSNDRIAPFFPRTGSKVMHSARLVASIADLDLVDYFCRSVEAISVYG